MNIFITASSNIYIYYLLAIVRFILILCWSFLIGSDWVRNCINRNGPNPTNFFTKIHRFHTRLPRSEIGQENLFLRLIKENLIREAHKSKQIAFMGFLGGISYPNLSPNGHVGDTFRFNVEST